MKNKIKVGDVFKSNEGSFYTVIKKLNGYTFAIRFNDENQYIRSVSASNIKSGTIKNPFFINTYGVGYLGVGIFSSRRKGETGLSYEYRTWRNMLRRVYAPDTQRDIKAYKGCSVCGEWFNFQNFAKWLNENECYEKNYQLDKDILLQGNKEYSPSACSLIPQQINKIFSDPCKGSRSYLVGVRKKSSEKKYSSVLTVNAKQVFIGVFGTEQEAHQAYVVAKEAYVKEVANKWRGRIDERVYDALMNWRVTQ